MDDLLLVAGKGAEQLLVEVQKEDSGSATVEYLRTRGVEFTTKPSWASRLIPTPTTTSAVSPDTSPYFPISPSSFLDCYLVPFTDWNTKQITHRYQ